MLYLRATLLAQTGKVTVRSRHLRAPVTLRLGSSDFVMYGQVILDGAYDLPLRHPPRVIVDAGANIGLASIYFANRYPEARILALEPEAANFALLQQNSIPYPQITPIQAALWHQVAELDLFNPSDRRGRHSAYRVQDHSPDELQTKMKPVAAITIPSLQKTYSLSQIDLLKIDIEGAEREVFAHSASWIGGIGVIVAELHDRIQRGCSLSFYTASQGFEAEWHMGEHVYVARREWLQDSFLQRRGYHGKTRS